MVVVYTSTSGMPIVATTSMIHSVRSLLAARDSVRLFAGSLLAVTRLGHNASPNSGGGSVLALHDRTRRQRE